MCGYKELTVNRNRSFIIINAERRQKSTFFLSYKRFPEPSKYFKGIQNLRIPDFKKFSQKNFTQKVAMEHRITFRTPDGVLQEKMFDNFNEFANNIDEIANQYYAGMKPEVSVETIYDSMVRKEKVTNEQQGDNRGMEFLGETGPEPQG